MKKVDREKYFHKTTIWLDDRTHEILHLIRIRSRSMHLGQAIECLLSMTHEEREKMVASLDYIVTEASDKGAE